MRRTSCRHSRAISRTRSGCCRLSDLLLGAELEPALLADFDAVLVGRLLDPPPGRVALVVADAFDLVEAGDRVADVAGIVERLLALLGECELVLVEAVALLFVEFGHESSPAQGRFKNAPHSRSLHEM